MSHLAKMLLGAVSSTTVTGTLTGSGTLNIPQGVGLVTLTGSGGTGGDNSWYDPGQTYIAAVYSWGSAGVTALPTVTDPPAAEYLNGTGAPSVFWTAQTTPRSASDTCYGLSCTFDGTYYHKFIHEYSTITVVAGQDYRAPSSGGGPYSGPNTTATLNGVTDTWNGGYGAGVAGTVSVQTLASTGAGQTLTYSVGAGGSLSYSYTY